MWLAKALQGWKRVRLHHLLNCSGSQRAGLHVRMNITSLLSSRTLPSFVLVSLWKCNQRNVPEGNANLSFLYRREKCEKKHQIWKKRNNEPSKCAIEEAMMQTLEVISERSPSRLSCDWSLCSCIYDVSASSLMFCAKLLDFLACCLTLNLLMYIFTYLSKNLWSEVKAVWTEIY